MNENICIMCGKFAQGIENGICTKCRDSSIPHPIYFKRVGRDLIPVTQTGIILSREKWINIKRDIDKFYQYTLDDKIEKENFKTREEMRIKHCHPIKMMPFDGYIYLMKASNGFYKIGRSRAVGKRLNQIIREYPIHIEVIHYFPCESHVDAELYLHSLFEDSRLQGEWFELDEDQANWIKSLDLEKMGELLKLNNIRTTKRSKSNISDFNRNDP